MDNFFKQMGDIRFLAVEDFFEKKEKIKKGYGELSGDCKELYKWYFHYQLCFLKNPLKRVFWDYLNDTLKDEYVLELEYSKFLDDRFKLIDRIRRKKDEL